MIAEQVTARLHEAEQPDTRSETLPQAGWLDANQRYLSAEFRRLAAHLDGRDEQLLRAEAEAVAAHDQVLGRATIDIVTSVFSLSAFERDVVLLAAGTEMDQNLAERCGMARGLLAPGFATVSIALVNLNGGHWSAVAPSAPLRRWRLIELIGDGPLTAATIRVEERILHFLAGINEWDRRVLPYVRHVSDRHLVATAHAALAADIGRELRRSRQATVVQLAGSDGEGKRDVAKSIADHLGFTLHEMFARDLPAAASERAALADLITRDSLLLGSAILLTVDQEPTETHSITDFVDAVGSWPIFIAAPDALELRRMTRTAVVERPEGPERRRLWRTALSRTPLAKRRDLDEVADQFRLSSWEIDSIATVIVDSLDAMDDPVAELRRACSLRTRAAMQHLAHRVEPRATWADLVLPDPTIVTLREIASQVRHQGLVHDAWGFGTRGARSVGVTALFSGESGTGKSLAAEVLASELDLDLYRIDLSSVVSKYIGETEKNLRQIFDAAEIGGGLLLFDEADALFGKRSEVRDSHDRYANVEVSFLLQRMEAYRGLAILTTNNKLALDRAFQRRLAFILQFPYPDQAQRELIWRTVFPSAVPMRKVDFARLSRLNVPGGAARNIARNAAFLAAAAKRPVIMADLRSAAAAEFAKTDRVLSGADLKDWR